MPSSRSIDRAPIAAALALSCMACGARAPDSRTGTTSAVETTSTAHAPADTAASEPASPPADAAPSIEARTLSAEDANTAPFRPLREALAGCDDPEDECDVAATAAWDAAGHRWIVLDVDASEGGPESLRLAAVTAEADTVIATRAVDRAGLAAVRRALRPFAALPAPAQLPVAAATTEWSLSVYADEVLLGGPLAGWHLALETNEDLDHPAWVLRLARDGATMELARIAATTTPCDGDGTTCEAHEGTCTDAELRAESRLCVQPRSIERAAIDDDHASLLVLGTAIVAGDGGYPGFHWVVPLPPDLTSSP